MMNANCTTQLKGKLPYCKRVKHSFGLFRQDDVVVFMQHTQ